jgi:protein TonB
VNRSPKLFRDQRTSGSPVEVVLVPDPGVSARPPQGMSFRLAVLISCLVVGGVAYAGSQWRQGLVRSSAEMTEVSVLVLSDGEMLEEARATEEVKLASEDLPPVVPAMPPARASALMTMPEGLPELAEPKELEPLAMEELLASAMESFPEAVTEEVPPAKKVVSKPRTSSAPKSASRSRESSRPKPSSSKQSARLVKRVPPTYPSSARRSGAEGRVVLLLTVGANGRVSSARIAKSSGSGALDRAALSAARRWTFEPARAGGKAVPSQVTAPVLFQLD